MSFLEIFQPDLRYLREERDRQKIMVVRPRAGEGPPLGIDLDAGTARLDPSRHTTQPDVPDGEALDEEG